MKARLTNVDRIAEDTAAFTFEVQEPFTFEPGQTCDITIPSPRYQDDKGSIRTFSITSAPGDLPRLMFATRVTGSAFKRMLVEGTPGLEIDVDGPYGSFVLHKNAAKTAIFFAGGIGITPFHSIIKDATARKLPHKLLLLYSNRTAASTAFLPDLEAAQRANPNFQLVATITDPGPPGAWPYSKGLMNAAFIKPHLQDANAIYYLAGPPSFVAAIRSVLGELDADPDNIRTEEFSGY